MTDEGLLQEIRERIAHWQAEGIAQVRTTTVVHYLEALLTMVGQAQGTRNRVRDNRTDRQLILEVLAKTGGPMSGDTIAEATGDAITRVQAGRRLVELRRDGVIVQAATRRRNRDGRWEGTYVLATAADCEAEKNGQGRPAQPGGEHLSPAGIPICR